MRIESEEKTVIVTIGKINREEKTIEYVGVDENSDYIFIDKYKTVEEFEKAVESVNILRKEKVKELRKKYSNFDEIPNNEKLITFELQQNT